MAERRQLLHEGCADEHHEVPGNAGVEPESKVDHVLFAQVEDLAKTLETSNSINHYACWACADSLRKLLDSGHNCTEKAVLEILKHARKVYQADYVRIEGFEWRLDHNALTQDYMESALGWLAQCVTRLCGVDASYGFSNASWSLVLEDRLSDYHLTAGIRVHALFRCTERLYEALHDVRNLSSSELDKPDKRRERERIKERTKDLERALRAFLRLADVSHSPVDHLEDDFRKMRSASRADA
ncbi:Fc.00g003070.m01.CDS01 [Cosmosporella sp. VM-42]